MSEGMTGSRGRDSSHFTLEQQIHYVIVPVPFVFAAIFATFDTVFRAPASPLDVGGCAVGYAFIAAAYAPRRLGALPRWVLTVVALVAAAAAVAVTGLNLFGLAAVIGGALGILGAVVNRRMAPGLGGSSTEPAAATS